MDFGSAVILTAFNTGLGMLMAHEKAVSKGNPSGTVGQGHVMSEADNLIMENHRQSLPEGLAEMCSNRLQTGQREKIIDLISFHTHLELTAYQRFNGPMLPRLRTSRHIRSEALTKSSTSSESPGLCLCRLPRGTLRDRRHVKISYL